MSIPIARPEHMLREAFEEKDRADKEFADHSQAVADAQKRIDAAQELQAAAQVQLKNAEARYSVLAKSHELAAPGLKALKARYDERKNDLDEVKRELEIVEEQTRTVQRAQTELLSLFGDLRGLRNEAIFAMEAMRTSIGEIQQLPQAAYRSAAVRNMCGALEDAHEQLRGRQEGYETALAGLEAAIGTLRVEGSFAGYEQALAARRQRLEGELAETGRELAEKQQQPGIDAGELQRASDDLEAAKFAVGKAPTEVRRAKADLHAASDALARAETRQQTAQGRLDDLEEQLVTSIEVSAPDPAGRVTASAVTSQDIPPGYSLSWTAGAALVVPKTGLRVTIHTGQLPVGQTLIEAELVRTPAVA